MSKKLIGLIFFFFPLLSYGTDIASQENSQIGRYQIIAHDTGCLYLLDTTNGYVWRSTCKGFCLYHDTWVLQIANFDN